MFPTLLGSSVGALETVCRYLVHRKDHGDGRVKGRALEPPPDGKTSVYRITDMEDAAVWDLAKVNVERVPDRLVLGRADFRAQAARDLGLDVTPEEPPIRHANVVNWPAAGGQDLRGVADENG